MLSRTLALCLTTLVLSLKSSLIGYSAVGDTLTFDGSAPDGSYNFVIFDGQAIAVRDQQILGSKGDGTWEILFESESELSELAANENFVLASNFSSQTISGSKVSEKWVFKVNSHPKEKPYSISAGDGFFLAMLSDGQEEPKSHPHYTKDGTKWTPVELDYAGNIYWTLATPIGYFLIGHDPMVGSRNLIKANSPDGSWEFFEIPVTGSLAYNKGSKRLLSIDGDRNAAYSIDGGRSWILEPGPSKNLGEDFITLKSVGDQFIAIGDTYKFSQYGSEWNQVPKGLYRPIAFAEDASGQIQTFYTNGDEVYLNSLAHLLGEIYEVSNEEAIGYLAQTPPAVPEPEKTLPESVTSNPLYVELPQGKLSPISEYEQVKVIKDRYKRLASAEYVVPFLGGILILQRRVVHLV